MSRADVQLIKSRISARVLCDALGLLVPGKSHAQARGFVVRCPWHEEKRASCSIQDVGGVVLANCFGCGASGDAFDLIAVVRGLDVARHFGAVLAEAADVAGVTIGSARTAQRSYPRLRCVPVAPREPQRLYPPPDEVAAFYSACAPVSECAESAGWLRSRCIDPEHADEGDLARAITASTPLPEWARCGAPNWFESGHRAVVPLFDEAGQLRSLRARLVFDGDATKELAPRGFSTAGLVAACPIARGILAGVARGDWVPRVVVSEGIPDWMTWSTRASDANVDTWATFGIASGAWSAAIAARIPDGALVAVRPHQDAAGEKYARAVIDSLRTRCRVVRSA